PNLAAGCSLAESADADDVADRIIELKEQYPDLAVVSYVNTTAAVKAHTDVCVTSSNAVKIVNSLPNSTILFLPDKNLANYVAQGTDKKIISWDGDCYVHHQIKPEQILELKESLPDAKIMVHPECRTDVLEVADAVLSTSGMIRYAKESDSNEFIVVTECGMSDRLSIEMPEKKFYKSCNLCKYMKMITIEDTKTALERLSPEVSLTPEIISQARGSIERMLELS
ncbi:MAG: quinolinate synthase NadA, partial [Candidatus Lindowbacteria bacterium]|nr:quinolinate synthase NadA [Candidatus Lindowbacteria bacterium]